MSAWFDASLKEMVAAPSTAADASWLQSARLAGRRCVAAVPDASTMPESAWTQACDFQQIVESATEACRVKPASGACTWSRLAQLAPTMPAVRRYERVFGVIEDEALEAKSSCSTIVPSARPR